MHSKDRATEVFGKAIGKKRKCASKRLRFRGAGKRIELTRAELHNLV